MASILLDCRDMVMVSRQFSHLEALQAAIQIKHQCQTKHRKSVFVTEKTGENETVWEGRVEVFDLKGHERAKTCYAWQAPRPQGVKIFTVLENQFIDSPRRAIQAAIFMDEQSPSSSNHESDGA